MALKVPQKSIIHTVKYRYLVFWLVLMLITSDFLTRGQRNGSPISSPVTWSCLTLRPHGLQTPGSSVYGILQARILEWVAMLSPRVSSQPRDQAWVFYVSCIGSKVLNPNQYSQSVSCLVVSEWIVCSPPGSSVHEILRARILEWVAISFSR